jgi:hypothetical protein
MVRVIQKVDWVGNVSNKISTSGFMFSFGSGVVSGSNKKQPTVALSSTEAECIGATVAACELIWLQKLLSYLGQSLDAPVVIYYDNISSILIANNLVYHARTKHIEVHYHFIREKVIAKEINLIHVSIEDQVVDIFTKALRIDKLKKFREMFGVLKVDLSLRGNVENSSSTS